jgi:hypothetical protein
MSTKVGEVHKVFSLVISIYINLVDQPFPTLNSHLSKSKKGAEAPFVVQTNLSLIKLECFYDV